MLWWAVAFVTKEQVTVLFYNSKVIHILSFIQRLHVVVLLRRADVFEITVKLYNDITTIKLSGNDGCLLQTIIKITDNVVQ